MKKGEAENQNRVGKQHIINYDKENYNFKMHLINNADDGSYCEY